LGVIVTVARTKYRGFCIETERDIIRVISLSSIDVDKIIGKFEKNEKTKFFSDWVKKVRAYFEGLDQNGVVEEE
jgi:hypothetical protein